MTAIEDSDLYREILANPADRELRLVFADWLEEQGDPRGQVVRMQCQLEGMSPDDRGYSTLKAKERKALKQYGGFGAQALSGVQAKTEVRAGFAEWIQITPTRLLKHAETIFRSAPILSVKLKGRSARFAKLAELPQLAQLQSLVLAGSKIDSDDLKALANSPYLSHLETFEVSSDELRSPGKVLSQSPLMQQLRSLRLSGFDVTDRDVELTVGAARQLESAHFSYIISDRSLEAIGSAAGLRSLRSLELNGYNRGAGFTASGMQSLAESEFDQPLKSLTIRPARGNMLRGLAGPRFRSVQRLEIVWTELTTQDVAAITDHLPELVELRLTATRLRNDAATVLAASPVLRNLRKLYLTGNGLTIKGVQALLDSPHFSPRTEYHLAGNNLKKSDIAAIRERAGKSFGNLSEEFKWRQ